MQPCDTNVWLALALSGHVHHDIARAWLETVDEPVTVYFCRVTQQAFLRLLTTNAVLAALTNAQAWDAYQAFAADDRIVMADREPSGIDDAWKGFAARKSASPKMWMDAYLAAFALRGGFELVTTDADFTQFHPLRLRLLTRT